MPDTSTIGEKPVTRDEIAQTVLEVLEAQNKGNKFLELLICRRTLSIAAVIIMVVAKHFGLNIDDQELLTVGIGVTGLVLSHGIRKPS